jgi:hypothetical protein
MHILSRILEPSLDKENPEIEPSLEVKTSIGLSLL